MKGYFGIGVYHPKSEVNIGTLWRSATILGASFIFTVGRRYKSQASDTTKTPRRMPLLHFVGMDELYAHLPYGCRLIGIELAQCAIPSHAYEHPEQGAYLLGAEDHGLPPSALERCHSIIRLPGERSLNVAVAGSMVMYDRWKQYEGANNTTQPAADHAAQLLLNA